MENQDKLYEQFLQAAQKAETKDFPAMDKVWARIEDKLDHKVLKKENKLWKKIAIAASFLLLMTIGYQFLNPEKDLEVVPNNSIVSPAKEEKFIPIDSVEKDAVVVTEEHYPLLKKNAEKILQHETQKQESVAYEEILSSGAPAMQEDAMEKKRSNTTDKTKEESEFTTQKFNAGSARRMPMAASSLVQTEAPTVQGKSDALVILDGKAMKDSSAKSIMNASSSDYETIAYLPNPLYVINGVQYSEQELFGPNPTSPYHPLNQQEILSTSILQGESATNLYGEKGKNGVVIITTKNGKPLKQ